MNILTEITPVLIDILMILVLSGLSFGMGYVIGYRIGKWKNKIK
jgi:hypothetical protein